MPKAQTMRKGTTQRHDPLAEQLSKDEARKYVSEEKGLRKRQRRDAQAKLRKEAEASNKDSKFMTSSLSRKILTTAREQLRDETRKSGKSSKPIVEEFEEFEEDEDDEGGELEYRNQDHFAELDISTEDEQAMARFMSTEPVARRTLADIIMEKIHEKEKQDTMNENGNVDDGENGGQLQEQTGLNPQVVSVYESVGKLLSRYRAGKLPKAFKIIPSLRNWEEVLYVTNPDSWSPQAMMAATRIFASNLNPRMAQRFYALVLLPRVRDDIHGNKVLNYHLYMALKKALYKPAAFFKGILLPLCDGGDCTLREATIIGSVLAKVSIPMVHAAAAMLKIASMPYSGASSLFLRVLMDKKYSLPYKVVDALVVKHFASFLKDDRKLPVLWHQALLVFAQRYKNVVSKEQKQLLRALLRKHHHYKITPEIRRELFASSTLPGVVSMEE